MDVDLDVYYSERFSMIGSTGWKHLIEDVKRLEEPLLNIKSVTNEQELNFRKGQLDIISWLLNTEVMAERTYNMLNTTRELNATI